MNKLNSIQIVFDDDNLLVIDKPANILTHPTLANEENTLTEWLVKKYPDIAKMPWLDKSRPGVVHRLDKDTSGLIILAKNPEVLLKLQKIFQSRQIQKTYTALVLGKLEGGGKIEAAITRGDAGLQKVLDTTYSFTKETIRTAATEYRAIKRLQYHNQ